MEKVNQLFDISEFQKLNLIKKEISYEIYETKNIKTGENCSATVLFNNPNNSIVQDPALLSQQFPILIQLNHRSILKIFNYSQKDFDGNPNLTILSEQISFRTLSDFIQSSSLEINDAQKLIIIYGIASGLSYLHSKQIIHQCLTPNSILINNISHPKLINHVIPFFQTSSNLSIFTPPEIQSKRTHSQSSNIYSFGLILYEILSGQVIDKPLTESIQLPTTPFCQSFAQIFEKCISTDPTLRPSMTDILHFLENEDTFNLDSAQKALYHNYIKDVQQFPGCNYFDNVFQYGDQTPIGSNTHDTFYKLQTKNELFEVHTNEKGIVNSITTDNKSIHITRGDGNIHFYDPQTRQINRTYNIEDVQCRDYIKIFQPDEDVPDSWFNMKAFPGNCYSPNYVENYRPPLMRIGIIDPNQKSGTPISTNGIKLMHDNINDKLLDSRLTALSLAHKTCLAFPILHQIAFKFLPGDNYINYGFKCSDKFIIDKLILSVYTLVSMIDHADEPDFSPKVSAGTIQHVALSLFRRIYYLANVAEIEELKKKEKNMNTNPFLDIPDKNEVLGVFCDVFLKMYFSKNGLGYIPLFCFAAWCACCNETIVHTKGAYPCFHVPGSPGRKPFNYIGFMLQSSLMYDNVSKLFSDNPPGLHPIIHYLGRKEIGTISRNGIQQTVISVSRTRPDRPNTQQRHYQHDSNRRPQSNFRNQRNNRNPQMNLQRFNSNPDTNHDYRMNRNQNGNQNARHYQ